MAQTKIASWYWITSAILTPFVLVASVTWAYYANESKRLYKEALQIHAQLKRDQKNFDPTRKAITEVAEQVGFAEGGPDQHVKAMATDVKASWTDPQEAALPKEDQNLIYRVARQAEEAFYGNGSSAGMIQQYMSARKFLHSFELEVRNYIAYKSYQYYTVTTVNQAGNTAPAAAGGEGGEGGEGAGSGSGLAAEGVIERPGKLDEGVYRPQSKDIDSAVNKRDSGKEPSEMGMRAPTRITLELIYRKQLQLVEDLVNANRHQHGILIGEVTGKVGDLRVGFQAEEHRKREIGLATDALMSDTTQRKNNSTAAMREAQEADADLAGESNVHKLWFEDQLNIVIEDLRQLASKYEQEREMHENDASAFEELTRNLPSLKQYVKIEKREPDGGVSFSDFARKSVHINLGRRSGVVSGQRFEVWRLHGRKKDVVIGVIEIVRTLSDHYSLCTVLSLVSEKDPIRRGDQIVNRLWHNGRFLKVALHGSFEPPNEAYSKARLTELLKKAGCTVRDKVQPGVDLVITGSSLMRDNWYRKARSDLRFEVLREDDVRIYVDPR